MTSCLIVGGGITGLATALVLRRQGVQVELIERDTEVSAIGSGITMISAGVRALDRLGLYEECAAAGYCVSDLELYNVDGTLAHRQRLPSPGADRPGMLGIMRPVLHQILLSHAAREGAQVQTATEPASIAQRTDGVTVTLGTGESRDYDLAVGADGLRSTVRGLVMGPVIPSYQGACAFRVVLPRLDDVTAHCTFRNCADVTIGLMPVADDRMYMYGTFSADESYRPSASDMVSLVQAKTEPYGGIVTAIREEIRDPGQIHITRFETVLAPEPWYRGRVIVIGDAAHCPTPQLAAGAALCLEDAIALGEELDTAATDDEGLRAFCERRYDRCRFVVETTTRISQLMTRAGASAEELLPMITACHQRLAGPF